MTDPIKRLFDDPKLPMNRFPKKYTAAAKLTRQRGEIYAQLKERLSPEELELLDKYSEKSLRLQGEYEYMTFRSGLECFIRLLMGIFFDR